MKQSKKTPILVGLLALFGLWLALTAPATTALLQTKADTDLLALPSVPLDVPLVSWIAFAVALLGAALVSWQVLLKNQKAAGWVAPLAGFGLVFALLCKLYAGQTLTITALLQGTLALAVPLIFGSLAGVMSERVGVVNIAIEGQLLAGAFVSAFVGSLTQNLWLGVLVAAIAGALVSLTLAAFAIKYVVDQIIVGVVLNVLVIGLTNFMFTTMMSSDLIKYNSPPRFDQVLIPVLGQIPVLGPVLFNQTPIVYLMYLAVAAVWFVLFKTRWGLRVRAVGEYPKAADTVGIKVYRTRYLAVLVGGALAGLGGTFFTLGQVGSFGKEMTSGAGYIALAALIFGRWNPIYAALAALLFGFAQNLQYGLAIIGSPVPSEFLLMLPYALTVVAVAGLVGKVTGPAAAGKPYLKS